MNRDFKTHTQHAVETQTNTNQVSKNDLNSPKCDGYAVISNNADNMEDHQINVKPVYNTSSEYQSYQQVYSGSKKAIAALHRQDKSSGIDKCKSNRGSLSPFKTLSAKNSKVFTNTGPIKEFSEQQYLSDKNIQKHYQKKVEMMKSTVTPFNIKIHQKAQLSLNTIEFKDLDKSNKGTEIQNRKSLPKKLYQRNFYNNQPGGALYSPKQSVIFSPVGAGQSDVIGQYKQMSKETIGRNINQCINQLEKAREQGIYSGTQNMKEPKAVNEFQYSSPAKPITNHNIARTRYQQQRQSPLKVSPNTNAKIRSNKLAQLSLPLKESSFDERRDDKNKALVDAAKSTQSGGMTFNDMCWIQINSNKLALKEISKSSYCQQRPRLNLNKPKQMPLSPREGCPTKSTIKRDDSYEPAITYISVTNDRDTSGYAPRTDTDLELTKTLPGNKKQRSICFSPILNNGNNKTLYDNKMDKIKPQEAILIPAVESVHKLQAQNDMMLSSNFSPNYGASSNGNTELDEIMREEHDNEETKSTNKEYVQSPLSPLSHQNGQFSNLDIEHLDKGMKSPLISPRQPRQIFEDSHDLLGTPTNKAKKIPIYQNHNYVQYKQREAEKKAPAHTAHTSKMFRQQKIISALKKPLHQTIKEGQDPTPLKPLSSSTNQQLHTTRVVKRKEIGTQDYTLGNQLNYLTSMNEQMGVLIEGWIGRIVANAPQANPVLKQKLQQQLRKKMYIQDIQFEGSGQQMSSGKHRNQGPPILTSRPNKTIKLSPIKKTRETKREVTKRRTSKVHERSAEGSQIYSFISQRNKYHERYSKKKQQDTSVDQNIQMFLDELQTDQSMADSSFGDLAGKKKIKQQNDMYKLKLPTVGQQQNQEKILKQVLHTSRDHSRDHGGKDGASNKILIRNCEKSRKSKHHGESFNEFGHSLSANRMNDSIDNPAEKSVNRSKQNESAEDVKTEFEEHMKDKQKLLMQRATTQYMNEHLLDKEDSPLTNKRTRRDLASRQNNQSQDLIVIQVEDEFGLNPVVQQHTQSMEVNLSLTDSHKNMHANQDKYPTVYNSSSKKFQEPQSPPKSLLKQSRFENDSPVKSLLKQREMEDMNTQDQRDQGQDDYCMKIGAKVRINDFQIVTDEERRKKASIAVIQPMSDRLLIDEDSLLQFQNHHNSIDCPNTQSLYNSIHQIFKSPDDSAISKSGRDIKTQSQMRKISNKIYMREKFQQYDQAYYSQVNEQYRNIQKKTFAKQENKVCKKGYRYRPSLHLDGVGSIDELLQPYNKAHESSWQSRGSKDGRIRTIRSRDSTNSNRSKKVFMELYVNQNGDRKKDHSKGSVQKCLEKEKSSVLQSSVHQPKRPKQSRD